MKKIIILALIASVVLAFASCNVNQPIIDDTTSQNASSADQDTTTVIPNTLPENSVEPEDYQKQHEGEYDIDFYAYESCWNADFEQDIGQYYKIVDAVLNYQTDITSVVATDFISLSVIYQDVFDLYNPLSGLVESADINDRDKTAHFEYICKTKEEHDNAIKMLNDEFLSITTKGMPENACDIIKTLVVERNVTSRIDYNWEYIETNRNDNLTDYEAFSTNLGVCHTYAAMCRFALTQLGVNTLEATSQINSMDFHAWFLAEFDGEWYHFDPTFTDDGSENFELEYFGMTTAEKTPDPEYAVVKYGSLGKAPHDVPLCESQRFASIRSAHDFKIIDGDSFECVYLWAESDETKKKDNFVFDCAA